ncbi:MAG TPA: adenylate/guanylate cyclase domain-containing protein [Candidatus Limnocylindria bacterium]|nr:adenylate/guanylate cyclase domain-containing protein [Candidatus Limnocylindria bacterium]
MPEERKLATVLFADIVDSTTLAGEHDPERIRAVFRRTFDRLRGVIETHGGTVEKFIGDEVMAVFGVPIAHDDDAQRAVRCALAIREETAAFEPAARLEVALRIGVNTGDVIASLDSGDQNLVTGQAVNVAARLRQAAIPGEILVGELTKRLTDRGIRYGELRVIEAKNIGPLEAWPAEMIATATPEQDRGLPGLRAPLIGRDGELQLLTDAYRRLTGEERPYLVTIFGPPGSGKSRLAEEFLAALGEARVRRGRCLPYGQAITFYAVQLMLREDIGLVANTSRETALATLDQAVRETFGDDEEADAVKRRVAVIAGLAEAKDALADVAEGEMAEELRWGVRRYFERRAGSSPLVLVFEDIHWAEPRLLELIEDLAEWSRAPLLILCLARPDLREARPNWGGGATNATAIALSPLTGDQARTLIAELLATDDLSEQLRSEVVTRAEGNPLYVEEFLRMLMETGQIAQHGGRWLAVGGLEALEVPRTLQGLITARLDRVSPEVKALLQRASLPGRLFSTSALAALAGEPPRPEQLREAVRRDLLVESDERAPVGTGRVYRFKHVLIRDVAYSTLPKAERSLLHDRYGRWIETAVGERSAEIADVLAFHAEQAYLLARELDAEDALGLGRRAFDLVVAAADRARKRDDYPAATNLYDRSVRIAATIDASPQEQVHVNGQSAIYDWLQEPDFRLARFDELIGQGRRVGPSETLANLLVFRAMSERQHDLDLSRTLYAEALSVARAVGDAETIAWIWRLSRVPAMWIGDLDEAERVLVEADAYERAHAISRGRAQSLAQLAAVKRERAQFSAATAYLDEAAPLVEASRSRFKRWTRARALFELANAVGDHAQAIVRGTEQLGVGEEVGFPEFIAEGCWALGEALLDAGDYERARATLERSIELYGPDDRSARPELLAHLARASLGLGHIAEAGSRAEEAETIALPWDAQALVVVRTVAGMVAARRGDVVGAEARFREAIEGIARTQFDLETAVARLRFARFLIDRTRTAEARDQLAAARSVFSDPLAFRRRDEIDALLRQCDAVRT